MKSSTISEGFRDAINNRRVERAFFSTYCLEPDFFELEVLPLMLGTPALSTAEPIRYHQLQSLMGASRGRFGVAYDTSVFAPTLAPCLEVDYLPLQVGGACHHAKLAIIEVVDEQDNHAVILCAGSFNLTKAGWWENIEVGHWVELSVSDAPANILLPLQRALDYYLAQGALPVLRDLHDLVSSWSPSNNHPNCSFYFSGAGEHKFINFLKPVAKGQIEIVSPYFAEDSNNGKLKHFFGKFDKVALLLPRDVDGTATVTKNFYDGLGEHVRWCDWTPAIAKDFKLHAADKADKTGYRKLHAKIYAGADWQFIGSVNLSYKAMVDNVEAGFLLTNITRRRLLGKATEAEQFAKTLPVEAPSLDAGALAFPPVFLVFDWNTVELEASCPQEGTLVLHDREGAETLRLVLAGAPARLRAEGLREHLRHSSLVLARWEDNDKSSVPRNVIVSQRQVYCRPSTLPPMSLQDLLRILQSMHPASRVEAYGRLAARLQRLGPNDTDSLEFLAPPPPAANVTTFFAEFSQVNAAFWQLKQHLRNAPAEVGYYLDGELPDSFRGIVRAMRDSAHQTTSASVVRYLSLLSMDELLDLHGRGSDALADEVRRLLTLEENSPAFQHMPEKDKFLAWIKRMFVLPVSPIEETDAEN